MKKISLTIAGILLCSGFIFAQNNKTKIVAQQPVQRCAVMEHELYLEQQNPNRAAERRAYEQNIQNTIASQQTQHATPPVYIIPVVVHVVYFNTAQNISDNQILSQIEVLNEDFRRTNPDASNTPSYFTGVAADCEIQYCMAQRDPNGNATNGIERRQISTNVSFSTNDNVKHFNTNGLDAWDPSRYLNLWVCNLGGGLLGYGEFPTNTLSQTFGLVMGYTCFGSNYTSYGSGFTLISAYDRGRTSTHEIGHCFDLYHIWGDDGSSCSGSDLCADTPNQADEHYGCPSGSQVSCTNGPNGDMYQNYMDYSDDICMNLFTTNQKTRMRAVITSAPYNTLTTSNGCQPVAVGTDAGISAIGTPNGNICGTSFIPSVTLRNFGTNTLTSCTINYRIDNNSNLTYSWTGSLTVGNTTVVTLPSMTTTTGAHTFTCFSSSPNNGTDVNATNDQFVSNFNSVSNGAALPIFEGFEGTTFVPVGWSLNNPDGSNTWDRTTTCSKTGVACARMDNWSYQTGNGQIDEMTMLAVDLSTANNPVLTFQVAYTYWTNPYQYSDTLNVYVSTNCGLTWTQVYNKFGAQLQTAPPLTSNSVAFIPNSTQWRLETVSLSPYIGNGTVYVKFRNASSYEDNLYIDDINIMSVTGVSENDFNNNVNLFPNPSNTGMFNMNIALANRNNLTVRVSNALGQTVSQFTENNTTGGQYSLDLSTQPNGVYFVEVTAGDEKSVQRIVINR
jgi:Secretion system C-terminal sorting domain/Pregnancy-associated plasma protein-A